MKEIKSELAEENTGSNEDPQLSDREAQDWVIDQNLKLGSSSFTPVVEKCLEEIRKNMGSRHSVSESTVEYDS